MTGSEFYYKSLFPVSSNHNLVHGFEFNLESMNPSFSFATNLQPPIPNFPSLDLTPLAESAYNSEIGDFSPAVLKYINDILMEEDLGDKPCMLQDSLALQIAEKSLYDVLGEKCPPFSVQNAGNPDENFTPNSSVDSNNLIEFNSNFYNQVEFDSFVSQPSHFYSANFRQLSGVYTANFAATSNPSKPADLVAQNEENNRRGRKNCQHENNGCLEEGRSKKQSLVSAGVSEQLEIFDKSFLHKVKIKEAIPCPLYDASKNEESKKLQHNEHSQAYNSREKRLGNQKMVDLSSSLMHCAQAASNGDQKTAYEQLKQIRLHSSPFGDGNQRSAHYFANALEARLSGTGKLLLTPNLGHSTNAADILKSYQLYVSISPFRKMTNFYSNRTIAKAACKATRLHIIDFGISYGFQWPCLLYRLSTRPGGPPKIRITGIDFPQPGFRPAERVEETGRRLKTLADKLNVPFEYNAIAQKWETIRYEDLKIDREEVVAVCCMNRLKNLQDDTIVLNSPRDAVLKLIKKINPNIFVHGVVNGSFNAPFFTSRFREAFFHYSSLFDMFEANVIREDHERLVFEREIIGKDVMNVIACEGTERYERPETYKQWQIRNSRIGFRQLPLHQDLMKRVRNIKNNYHKDFVIDEDGHWVLMGWKGRIIHAISAWKVVQD